MQHRGTDVRNTVRHDAPQNGGRKEIDGRPGNSARKDQKPHTHDQAGKNSGSRLKTVAASARTIYACFHNNLLFAWAKEHPSRGTPARLINITSEHLCLCHAETCCCYPYLSLELAKWCYRAARQAGVGHSDGACPCHREQCYCPHRCLN